MINIFFYLKLKRHSLPAPQRTIPQSNRKQMWKGPREKIQKMSPASAQGRSVTHFQVNILRKGEHRRVQRKPTNQGTLCSPRRCLQCAGWLICSLFHMPRETFHVLSLKLDSQRLVTPTATVRGWLHPPLQSSSLLTTRHTLIRLQSICSSAGVIRN